MKAMAPNLLNMTEKALCSSHRIKTRTEYLLYDTQKLTCHGLIIGE